MVDVAQLEDDQCVEGHFADLPLHQLLTEVAEAQVTGRLTVPATAGENHMFFMRGQPVGFTLAETTHPLAQILMESGRLTSATFVKAQRLIAEGQRLPEQVFQELGVLDEGSLKEVLAEQSRLHAEHFGTLGPQPFRFCKGLTYLSGFRSTPLHVQAVIFFILRQQMDDAERQAWLQNVAGKEVGAPGHGELPLPAPLAAYGFGPPEERFLRRIAMGCEAVEHLAETGTLPADEMALLLRYLQLAGRLTVREPAPTPPRPADPAPAAPAPAPPPQTPAPPPPAAPAPASPPQRPAPPPPAAPAPASPPQRPAPPPPAASAVAEPTRRVSLASISGEAEPERPPQPLPTPPAPARAASPAPPKPAAPQVETDGTPAWDDSDIFASSADSGPFSERSGEDFAEMSAGHRQPGPGAALGAPSAPPRAALLVEPEAPPKAPRANVKRVESLLGGAGPASPPDAEALRSFPSQASLQDEAPKKKKKGRRSEPEPSSGSSAVSVVRREKTEMVSLPSIVIEPDLGDDP